MARLTTARRPLITLLAAAAASSCTIIDPAPLSDRDRRFAVPAAPRGTPAGCQDNDSSDACAAPPEGLDDYVGSLALAMWEVDLDRRALVRQGLERARLNSAFNALTWPAVAFAGAKRLRDPGWSVRDAVALGFAAYKVLGEGIPERDRIYLQTANRLACSMLVAEASLYLSAPRTTDRARDFALDRHLVRLDAGISTYPQQRAITLGALKVTPAPPAVRPNDAVHKRRLEALGRGGNAGGAGGGADLVAKFQTVTTATLADAQATRVQARQTVADVLDAGPLLKSRSSRIQGAMLAELQARAPAAADPLASARSMVDALNQSLAKAAESAAKQTTNGAASAQSRSGADDPPWEPTPDRLARLKAPAADSLQAFWLDHELPMRAIRKDTLDWLNLHQRRVDETRREAVRLGCGDEDLSAFITKLAVRAALPAPPASAASASGSNESALPRAGSGTP